jgi:hypothetical protein
MAFPRVRAGQFVSTTFRLANRRANLDHGPDRLVSKDAPLGHRGNIAPKDVQIRSADGRHVHLHDHVPPSVRPASRSDKMSNREPESDRRGDPELDCRHVTVTS